MRSFLAGVGRVMICDGCHEEMSYGEIVEISGKNFHLCDSCCKGIIGIIKRGVVEGDWL